MAPLAASESGFALPAAEWAQGKADAAAAAAAAGEGAAGKPKEEAFKPAKGSGESRGSSKRTPNARWGSSVPQAKVKRGKAIKVSAAICHVEQRPASSGGSLASIRSRPQSTLQVFSLFAHANCCRGWLALAALTAT